MYISARHFALEFTAFERSKGTRQIPDDHEPPPGFWHLATSEGTPGHALAMGFVVGTILTVINQGDFILAGEAPDFLKMGLTYLVPYCVATYGAVTAKRAAWRRRNTSQGAPEP